MFSEEMLAKLLPMLGLFGTGILETIYMTAVSTAFAYLIGLPLGLVLVVTDKEGITPKPILNKTLGLAVNVLRSVPFIILLVALLPFTRMIVGTTLGSTAMIVSLVVAAFPFVARLVESSIKEVDRGVIEAAQSMGATPWQIVSRVMLTEAAPSLLVGAAIATTTILSYSAMAGIVGGGGLGGIAINYGYYRRQEIVMLVAVALLVVIVQVFQEYGMRITRKIDKRQNEN
ncbi:MAG: methionine ABC transporter permease [Oscillospiraceae bacterium]